MADDITIKVIVDAAGTPAAVQQVVTQLQALGNAGRAGAGAATTAVQQFHAATTTAAQGSAASLNMLVAGFGNIAGAVHGAHSALALLKGGLVALGVIEAAEKVREFVTSMAEMGENAVIAAAAVGTTTEKFSILCGAMQLAGGDANAALRALQILATHIQTALHDPLSKARDDFAKLGISGRDLEAALRDPPSLVDKLAEGFKRLNDEGRRGEAVVALRELVGRGNIALVAVLEGGTEEVQRLKKAFYETGASIDDNVGRSMKDVIEKIRLIEDQWLGVGIAIFNNLTTPINAALDAVLAFGRAVQALPHWFGTHLPPGVTGAAADEFAVLAEVRQRESKGAYDTFHATGQKVSSLAEVEALPGKSHAFGAYGFQPSTYKEMAAITGLMDISPTSQDTNALALLRKYGPNSTHSWAASGPYDVAAISAAATGGTAAGGTASTTLPDVVTIPARTDDENRKAFLADLEARIADANRKAMAGDLAAFNQWKQLNQEKIGLLSKLYSGDQAERDKAREEMAKRGAALPPEQVTRATEHVTAGTEAFRREQFGEAEQRVARQQQLDQLALAEFTASERMKVVLGQQSHEAELRNEEAFYARRLALQKSALQTILSDDQLDVKQKQKVNDQIAHVDAEMATRHVQAAEREAAAVKAVMEKWIQPVKNALDSIGHSFESALTGLLTRQTTWAKAMQSISQAATGALVSAAGGIASKIGGSLLGGKAGEGIGEVIANKLQSALASMLPSLIPKPAEAIGQAAVVSAVTAGAATTATAIATETSVLSGWLAAIFAKPSVAGFSFAEGGIVPSAAGGMSVGGFGGGGIPSILHPREMVLPAKLADTVRRGSEAQGGMIGAVPHISMPMTFVGPNDGPSLQRWFEANQDTFNGMIRRAFRSNGVKLA